MRSSGARQCGDCVVCCYHCDVPDMNSPAGVLCNKNTGTGCSIYESRPEICKPFKCLWLDQEQIPDELRPDKCGIMFETPFNCNTWIGYKHPDFEGNPLEDNELLKLISKVNEAGYSVVLLLDDDKKIYSLAPGMSRPDMHEQLNSTVFKHLGLAV